MSSLHYFKCLSQRGQASAWVLEDVWPLVLSRLVFLTTLSRCIPWGHREGSHEGEVRSTPGRVASSSQSPMGAFSGLVFCSKVTQQCSEGVLVPAPTAPYCLKHLSCFVHTGARTQNPPFLSPVPTGLSCHRLFVQVHRTLICIRLTKSGINMI